MSKNKMKEIRCPSCGKKLCYTNGDLEIKCTRSGCSAIVSYKYDSDDYKSRKEPPRSTISGKTFYY